MNIEIRHILIRMFYGYCKNFFMMLDCFCRNKRQAL